MALRNSSTSLGSIWVFNHSRHAGSRASGLEGCLSLRRLSACPFPLVGDSLIIEQHAEPYGSGDRRLRHPGRSALSSGESPSYHCLLPTIHWVPELRVRQGQVFWTSFSLAHETMKAGIRLTLHDTRLQRGVCFWPGHRTSLAPKDLNMFTCKVSMPRNLIPFMSAGVVDGSHTVCENQGKVLPMVSSPLIPVFSVN